MIRHIFKLIRTQWKDNFWILLELFIVLCLMWYIVDYFSIMFLNSRTSTGFEIEDTYVVNISNYQSTNPNYIKYEPGSDEPLQNYLRIVDRIKQHPDVKAVSVGQWHYPYCGSNMSNSFRYDTLEAHPQVLYVTPEYFEIFKVHPAGGGSPAQLAEAIKNGVILSSTTAEILFPDKNPVGQEMLSGDSSKTYRVTGVSTALKTHLFVRPGRYIYLPFEENRNAGRDEATIRQNFNIAFQARPGLKSQDFTKAFKKDMSTQLKIGNYYLNGITPISDLREQTLKFYGVYESIQTRTGFSIFFLFNVFLGVLGTFWLRIEKRKEEIGLRMAVGSSRGKVMSQMMTESFVLVSLALIPAVIVWLNLYWMEILPVGTCDLTWKRFLLNVLFTLVPLCLIVALGNWYPARKSSTIQPAEALHYE